jgi:hypothetical protein
MTRGVEPMIDLHQAPHNTNMIEMRRCHLDVPLGKKVQLACAIALFASIPCIARAQTSPTEARHRQASLYLRLSDGGWLPVKRCVGAVQ